MRLVSFLAELPSNQYVAIMDDYGQELYEGYVRNCDDGRFSEAWEVLEHSYCGGVLNIWVD